MKVCHIFIVFLSFIILCFSVSAANNYTTLGLDYEPTFQTGYGLFNENFDFDSIDGQAIRGGSWRMNTTPKILDIDNDGDIELIAIDGNTIRLYNPEVLASGASLTIKDAHIMEGSFVDGDFEISDLDDDGFSEIITVRQATGGALYPIAVEYNSTHFISRNFSGGLGISAAANGYSLKCHDGVDICFFLSYNVTTSGHNNYMVFLNNTHKGTERALPGGGRSPIIRSMSLVDFDNDDDLDWCFTYAVQSGADCNYNLRCLEAPPDLDSDTFTLTAEVQTITNSGTCQEYTSPLFHNFDEAGGNGLEAVYAIQENDDENFDIYYFFSSGVLDRKYPNAADEIVLDGDGKLVSNPMLFNSHTDTGNSDFCVMGFDDDEETIDLICGSALSSDIVNTKTFEFAIGDIYNISSNFAMVSHSGNHKQTTTDGTNLNELITTYGIFELDYGGVNDLDSLFLFPNNESAVAIMADADDDGANDLFIQTPTQLRYIDDGFTNSQTAFTNYYINPCIDRVWRQNTSVEVSITGTDADADQYRARAILYAGTADAQDSGWSSPNPSGSAIAIGNLKANVTGLGITLQMMVNDTNANNLIPTTVNITVSVAEQGVVWGDCDTDQAVEAAAATGTAGAECSDSSDCSDGFYCDDGECTALPSSSDNALNRGLKDTSALFNITPFLLVIFALFFANWGIIQSLGHHAGNHLVSMILLMDAFLVIMASAIGFLSTAATIVLILVIVMIGSIIIAGKTFSQGGGA